MLSEGELHVQAMRLVCEALADREKTGLEVDWDVINQQLDHMDVILQGITDQRKDDAEQIQILKQERNAAEAKISKLRQELSADAVRQELESLKAKNFALQEKLATVENAAATANETLRQQLDAAVSATIDVRRRLAEEINRHNATNVEKIDLFQKLEWANQHAAELVRERDAALATVDLQRAGIELLNTCLSKIRQHVAGMHEQEDLMEVLVDIRSALDELGEGTSEPAPATEPAHCPECERWQRAQRINSELFASKEKEIKRLNAFVGKVRSVVDHDRDGQEIDEMIEALGELDAGTSEPAQLPKIDVDFDNAWKRRYGVSAYEQSTTEPEGVK